MAPAAKGFLTRLADEIRVHSAVRHPFLERFAEETLTIEQLRSFGLQHYQLVRIFTTYMTQLAARLPGATEALRGVFDDEFGQTTIFRSHVHLYRTFLKALGLRDEDWGAARWTEETGLFIEGHLRLTREGSALDALGALGPGHELSIPPMFERLRTGLLRSGLVSESDIEYFTLHISEDEHHAAQFDALIERLAAAEADFEAVRRGALFSLALRRRFWDGCGRLVFGPQRPVSARDVFGPALGGSPR